MPLPLSPPVMLTDLYELAMAEVYFREEMFGTATFSLFIREYPQNRSYFVNAGLAQVLDFLESMHFTSEDLAFLDSTGMFSDAFLAHLSELRFTGEVAAMEEGRLFFKDEPVLEITAPIIEGQLAETAVINIVNLQANIATKVSRCVNAARGRGIFDFSLRRAQGADAGMAVARAGYIAGLSGTSNVLAGKELGIAISGTMAHSFILSFPTEIDAFRSFARRYGDDTVLLIDTYDTLKGAEKALAVAREMAGRGQRLRGVRLDSGDMTALSRQVRDLFRREGFDDVEIFASGGFDEFKIDSSIRDGAEIDAFGVGSKMGVSADSPYTDMAYKLVQYDGRPVLKLSSGKQTLVSPKQVFRRESGGRIAGDTIGLRDDQEAGEALLQIVMAQGRRTRPADTLEAARGRFEAEFAKLPENVRKIEAPSLMPVAVNRRLETLQHAIRQQAVGRELDARGIESKRES